MVRFKVIKGSHLALVLSILVLAAVLFFIILTGNPEKKETLATPSIVEFKQESASYDEAKAFAAFASSTVPGTNLKIKVHPDEQEAAVSDASPSILIYHTHTHEAYAQDASDPYEVIESWRTLDEGHNVVRVGAALADELRKQGYSVVHDKTDHEQDDINEAYLRSLKTLEGYETEFDLCIDLHRDAYAEGLEICLRRENAQEYAQLMFLVGRADQYEDEQKPDYEKNLEFAQLITRLLNREIPGICRNVTVKQGRYNQHIGERSLLIEAGHNRNTLEQTLASIPYLAQAIHSAMRQNY